MQFIPWEKLETIIWDCCEYWRNGGSLLDGGWGLRTGGGEMKGSADTRGRPFGIQVEMGK